ncbi:hypothetical protein [Streptomyces tateyamensis]|nr:hypothetical protein [Streptomyces tateyamensis]
MILFYAVLVGAACGLVLATGLRWLAAAIQLLIDLTTTKPKGGTR